MTSQLEAIIFFTVFGLIVVISIYRMMTAPVSKVSIDEDRKDEVDIKSWNYRGNRED